MRLAVACVLLASLQSVLGLRLLAVVPLPGKSHFIFTNAMLSALASRGHSVTFVSPFSPPKPVANMRYIEIHTDHEKQFKKGLSSFESFTQHVTSDYFGFGADVVWKLSHTFCEDILKHKTIQELITKEKFDIVLVEALFGQESLTVLGHIFQAPVVNLNGFGPYNVINKVHGNDLQIAIAPDVVSFPFSHDMTFLERLRNLVSTVRTLTSYYYEHLPSHDALVRRVFPDRVIPPVQELVANVSLTLANFHPLVSYPISLPPNIIPVGGINIVQEPPPLPKDIQEFMDSGKNAVIYFSMGSVVPVHLLPPEYLQTFITVFKKLPYKVLWKIEADSVPGLPKNVMISKWLPQQSVLAHPNCVLFITHGGLLSQHEVFHAGVPVVGIPFFGDQPFNVGLYEALGTGVKLDFSTITEKSMTQAILSVVGKPKFVERAKQVSSIYRHRAMSPADTAVYWVEYVARHGGAPHLRPYAVHMPWYTLALLDIVVAALGLVVVVLFLMRRILSLLCGCVRGGKSTTTAAAAKKRN